MKYIGSKSYSRGSAERNRWGIESRDVILFRYTDAMNEVALWEQIEDATEQIEGRSVRPCLGLDEIHTCMTNFFFDAVNIPSSPKITLSEFSHIIGRAT